MGRGDVDGGEGKVGMEEGWQTVREKVGGFTLNCSDLPGFGYHRDREGWMDGEGGWACLNSSTYCVAGREMERCKGGKKKRVEGGSSRQFVWHDCCQIHTSE